MMDEESVRRSQHQVADTGVMSTMAADATMPGPAPTGLLTTGHVRPVDKGKTRLKVSRVHGVQFIFL